MSKNKFTAKEKRILSITLGIWGTFLVISGLIMNTQMSIKCMFIRRIMT